MLVMAPADENECRQMLYTGFMHEGPASVRYPRGKGPGVAVNKTMTALPIGKAEDSSSRQSHCHSGLGQHGNTGYGSRQTSGRNRGQHAFCQTYR